MAGVDPFGIIYPTVAQDCTLMGNRGNLIKEGIIVRPWQGRRWIYCTCEGPRIVVSYTKLFFRDEATALAAGHRPCFTCLRGRFDGFVDAWTAANPEHGILPGTGAADAIDRVLDKERKAEKKWEAPMVGLPDGAMVGLIGKEGAYLIRQGKLLRWSKTGYEEAIEATPVGRVVVLTPPSVVRTLFLGFAKDRL